MALRAALCALKVSGKAQIRSRSVFNAIKRDKHLANINILFNHPNIVHTNIAQYAATRRKLRIKTTKEKEDPKLEKTTDADKTPKNEPVVKDVAYYFDKARNLEWKEKHTEALKAYQKADSLEPDNPLIQFGLGSVYLTLNQIDKAIEYLKKTIRLAEMIKKPDERLVQTAAQAYNNLAIIRFEQGKLELAKKNFKKAIIINREIPDIYVNLGMICIRQKKFSEAIEHLKQGLVVFQEREKRGQDESPEEESAKIAYLYQQLGIAYGASGKPLKADKALKKSHALNPNDFAVVRMLAALSQERGDHAAAIQYYEQVLEFDEEDKYAHAALGALYSREDLPEFNIPMAVEHLEKAFELDPDRIDIAMALGIIHFNHTGNFDKAVPYLMEVLRAREQEPQRTYMAHITLANIALVADPQHNTLLMQAEKARQAVNHFIKAANITPNPALYENIAQCYLKIGEIDQAINALESSINLNDQRAQPISWLALLYLKQEQFERAQTLAAQALTLSPHNRLGNYILGRLAFRAKDYDTTIQKITAALSETEPAQEATYIDVFQTDSTLVRDSLRILSEALQARGDYEEALNVTTQALANNAEDFELAFRAGTLYREKGDLEKAALMFRRACVVEPNSIEAPLRLSEVLMTMDDYSQSLAYLNKAIANAEKHQPEQVQALTAIRQAITVLSSGKK